MTLLLKYWKQIVAFAAICAIIISGYYYAYNNGYDNAKLKYEREIELYNKKIDKQIVQLESKSTVLIEQLLLSNQATGKDLASIMELVKEKPLYIVDTAGKYKLSPDFIKTFNAGVDRANK